MYEHESNTTSIIVIDLLVVSFLDSNLKKIHARSHVRLLLRSSGKGLWRGCVSYDEEERKEEERDEVKSGMYLS